jgi:hypothetical protein
VNKMSKFEKTKKTTKNYGVGSFGLTFLLLVIFGLVGGIIGGWLGLFVGILMVLMTSVISWIGLVPFGGIPLYIMFYNIFMDWLYTIAPSMGSLLAQDALPRIILYWIFFIMTGIVCVIMSAFAVIIIIGGIAAVLSWRD